MLFHVREEPGIERFEPRPSEYTDEPAVWAIDVEHLRNYLPGWRVATDTEIEDTHHVIGIGEFN